MCYLNIYVKLKCIEFSFCWTGTYDSKSTSDLKKNKKSNAKIIFVILFKQNNHNFLQEYIKKVLFLNYTQAILQQVDRVGHTRQVSLLDRHCFSELWVYFFFFSFFFSYIHSYSKSKTVLFFKSRACTFDIIAFFHKVIWDNNSYKFQ